MPLQLHLALLVLLAAVVHASWNAVVKSSGDRFLTFTVIAFTGTVIGAIAAFFVPLPAPQVWPYLILSTAIHNVYYITLLLGYRYGDLSEVYPLARGSSPLIVLLLAAVFAAEVPQPMGLVGVAMVSAGIISLAFAGGRLTRARMRPIGLALTTGLLTACYTIVDGLGMRVSTSPWPYIVWLNLLEGIPFTLWAVVFRTRDLPDFVAVRWKSGVAGGCLSMLSYALILFALSQGAMAHVSALRETSVLFAAVIGAIVLKEGFGTGRILAAAVIGAGVILMQIGGQAMRPSVGSWIYVATAAFAIANGLYPLAWLEYTASALIVLFIAFEFRSVPVNQKIVGVVLIGVGLAAALGAGGGWSVAIDGIARSQKFLLLFFAVAWLQIPARESPALNAIGRTIISQPPGRRYLFLSVGVHMLGSTLNLAGLSLLTGMVERQTDPALKRRLTSALMQGFTSASAWSPFYVSIVVILTVMPDLSWFDVVLPGLMTATGILASGFVFDRITRKRSDNPQTGRSPAPLPRNRRSALVFIPLSLVGLVVTLHEGGGISIPAALGSVAPVYALVWYGVIGGSFANWMPRSRDLTTRVLGVLPTMRSEILVFVGAYIFGTGIAGVVPAAAVAGLLDQLLPWIDARLTVLIFTVVLLGMAGLHPVVTVILAVQILPPEVIGLRDWVFASALLATWGLSTTVSPYSATSLFMARVTGVSNYIIAWRWNPPAIFFATAVVCTLIVAAHHLTL